LDEIIKQLKKAIKDNNSKKFADCICDFFDLYDPRNPDHNKYWPWLIHTSKDLVFKERYSLFKDNKEWKLDIHILGALEEVKINEEFKRLKIAVINNISKYEDLNMEKIKSAAKTNEAMRYFINKIPHDELENLVAIRSNLASSIGDYGVLLYTEYENHNPKAFHTEF